MFILFFCFITSFNIDYLLSGDYECVSSVGIDCDNISITKVEETDVNKTFHTKIKNSDILIYTNDLFMSGSISNGKEVFDFNLEKGYPFFSVHIRLDNRTLQINFVSISIVHVIYFNGTYAFPITFKKHIKFSEKLLLIRDFKIHMFVLFILIPILIIFLIKKLEECSPYKQTKENNKDERKIKVKQE